MKQIFNRLRCISIFIIAATSLCAHARLGIADRMELFRLGHNYQTHLAPAGMKRTMEPSAKLPAMITLRDGSSAADLEREGVAVAACRGGIAMVSVDCDDMERISDLPCVELLTLSRRRSLTMDKARPASGVSAVHSGEQLDQPYTGRGVVVGVVDQGLDPNHVNFQDAAGVNRFKYLSHIYENGRNPNGYSADFYGSDVVGKDISEFTTDEAGTYHGTHTLGILAGSYSGNVSGSGKLRMENPYQGVAPGADIAASCGDLMDMYIALGVDGIIEYAKYAERPAVISLSLGSNTGSHSHLAQMNQFLDVEAEHAVIVISAGNEGDQKLACRKNLSESDSELKTIIKSTYDENPKIRYGQIFVYSRQDFDLQAVTVNAARGGKIAYRMPVVVDSEYSVYMPASKAESGTIASTQFEKAFSDGYVAIGKEYDETSGEYVGVITYYTIDNTETNPDFDYLLGYVVKGTDGQYVESYAGDGLTELSDWGFEGWDRGSADGSINDMACGLNTIAVGSYNTRDTYPVDGGYASYEGMFPEGDVTFYSSWGTLSDGRSLPHVCAPGAAIVSSMNRYYINTLDDYYRYLNVSATAISGGVTNYWGPSHGTSMATPYVAGGIALWLEADPTLTSEEVREIIQLTATKDEGVLAGNPVQWGAGKFNAYEGLKEVLRRKAEGGVVEIASSADPMTVKVSEGFITVFAAGESDIDLTLYSASGSKALHQSGTGDEITVSTAALAPGIYIVRVAGHSPRRILVR